MIPTLSKVFDSTRLGTELLGTFRLPTPEKLDPRYYYLQLLITAFLGPFFMYSLI